MITLEYRGATALLDLLTQVKQGHYPSSEEISAVLDQNAFYVEYYSQWNGINRAKIVEVFENFSRPEWQPDHPVQAGMARGWRIALEYLELLRTNLEKFSAIDTSTVIERTSPYLPQGTPLDASAYLTVDGFNSGFQYQDGMGLSILMLDQVESVLRTISHELHHRGFSYWASRDPIRQAVLVEHSGREVAVRHIQNLLMEGMANYYCSPMHIDRETMGPALISRLEQLQRDRTALLTQAAEIFAQSMAPDADYEACQQACEALMIDYGGILPAGHMIGQWMIERMSQVHPQEAVIACVKSLADFLPLYNQAARQVGDPLFETSAVEQFSQVWHG